MKSLLRKQYTVLIITIIALSGVIVGAVTLFFLMKNRELRVYEVKQTLATYEQNKKTFAKEIATLDALETRIQTLESKKVTEESMPQLLSQIELLSTEKKVVTAITSVQTPTIEGVKKIFIDFSATGEFSSILSFVDALSSQEYRIRFTKLGLSQNTSTEIETVSGWELLATFEIISF